MNPAHNEAEIFMEALELDDPGERAAFVQRTCAGDSTLLKRVEGLLGRQSRLGRFLESPAVATDPCAQGPIWGPEGPGTMIGGRYKLLEQIGEGGFGVVYLAEQQEPVRREVALKIIKPGMDTRQVIARFEAERQALALMDHPNIAKVLDGGVINARGASAESEISTLKSQIPAGRPYFVMERVRGQPITQFCEDHQLPIRERLELFIAVCHAIQHAHQKGVIHRDIKPSNVLVTLDHGAPHPMVIDFGVAKALEQPLTERTLHTRFGQMIGTPAYMSPEQADLSRQDVDTRSDVYGLGILLYELLTGTTPFPEERLRTAGLAGILRILHEEEPLRPSTTVSRMNGRLRALALNRRSEPAALIQLIQGDLDWIVLKAIEKDRRRRYDSPADLAADVRRHLADEPVLARPPSTFYQLHKFARRHQVLVTATAVIAVMLVLTAAFSVWQALRATRAQGVAEEQRQEAAQQAAIAAAMNEFLTQDLLRQADVWKAEAHASPNRDIRLLEVVNRASEGVDAKFGNQPLVAAKIHLTVGSVYAGLGEIEKAEHHLRTAKRLFEEQVGSDDPRTLEASHALAVLLRVNRAAYEEAEALIRQVLNVRQGTLGPDHRDALSAMHELAWVCNDRQSIEEAEVMFAQVERQAGLVFGATDPLTLSAREGRINLRWQRGEREEAPALQRELWEDRKQIQGEAHPDTLQSLQLLVFYNQNTDPDYFQLEKLLDDGLRLGRQTVGEYAATFNLEFYKSMLVGQKGLVRESMDLRMRRMEAGERLYGPNHPRALAARLLPAFHHVVLGGKPIEAAELLEATLIDFKRVAPDAYNSQINRSWLVATYWQLGRYREALQMQSELVEMQERLYGLESQTVQIELRKLAGLFARLGDWDNALHLLEKLAGLSCATWRDLFNARLAQTLSLNSAQMGGNDRLDWKHVFESSEPEERVELFAALLVLADSNAMSRESHLLQTTFAPGAVHYSDDASEVNLRLWAAMEAIATEKWLLAIERLGPVAASAPEPQLRILAGLLLALALHHQGFPIEASAAFDHADATLFRLVAGGDMGSLIEPQSRWERIALSLLAHQQTAKFLAVQPNPLRVDAGYFAQARARWVPVQAAIDEAFLQARHRRWAEAQATIQSALSMERFAWEAAELMDPRWALKLAIIFASSGDDAAQNQLCENQPWDPSLASANARPVILFPLRAARSAETQCWVDARNLPDPLVGPDVAKPTGWAQLLDGLLYLRSDRIPEAIEAFVRAQGSFSYHCACAASAYLAQAYFHVNDASSARVALNEAESILARLQQSHGNDLGLLWFELRLCELAVEEARRLAQSNHAHHEQSD